MCDKATPGEWSVVEFQGWFVSRGMPTKRRPACIADNIKDESDARFIAAARTALPEALDEVERLEHFAKSNARFIGELQDELVTTRAEVERLRSEKDGAYSERNRCVAVIAWLAVRLAYRVWLGQHPDDPSWDPEWRTIVFVELPTGQVSWHIHDSERHLFEGVANSSTKPWDGHTTAEKYERCAALEGK